jgi:hypothetical protein
MADATAITESDDVHEMRIVIDRKRPLAPQVALYRALDVPWKILEQLSGKRRNRLEEAIARWRKSEEGTLA